MFCFSSNKCTLDDLFGADNDFEPVSELLDNKPIRKQTNQNENSPPQITVSDENYNQDMSQSLQNNSDNFQREFKSNLNRPRVEYLSGIYPKMKDLNQMYETIKNTEYI